MIRLVRDNEQGSKDPSSRLTFYRLFDRSLHVRTSNDRIGRSSSGFRSVPGHVPRQQWLAPLRLVIGSGFLTGSVC